MFGKFANSVGTVPSIREEDKMDLCEYKKCAIKMRAGNNNRIIETHHERHYQPSKARLSWLKLPTELE